MKAIIFLTLISIIFSKQILIRSGTGIKGVSYQWKLPGMREGCLFMAVCAIGGLGSDKEMLEARKWAVNKGYIRGSDTLLYKEAKALGSLISQQFKTKYNSNWSVKKGCNHYWALDGRGKEVFNAAGLGYTGCK